MSYLIHRIIIESSSHYVHFIDGETEAWTGKYLHSLHEGWGEPACSPSLLDSVVTVTWTGPEGRCLLCSFLPCSLTFYFFLRNTCGVCTSKDAWLKFKDPSQHGDTLKAHGSYRRGKVCGVPKLSSTVTGFRQTEAPAPATTGPTMWALPALFTPSARGHLSLGLRRHLCRLLHQTFKCFALTCGTSPSGMRPTWREPWT